MSLKTGNNNVASLAVGSFNVSAVYIGSTQIYTSVAGTPASLLLHFDGNLIDSSLNSLTVTAGGTSQVSSAESRFGSGSALFSGGEVGGYLTVENSQVLDLQYGDWTVELWFRPISLPTDGNLISISTAQSSYGQVRIRTSASTIGLLTLSMETGYWYDITTGGELIINQWHHIAATRSGNIFRLFLDGVKITEYEQTTDLGDSGGYYQIGGLYGDFDGVTVDGYIDEVRVVKGLAVYTDNFTPPTSPLSATITATPTTPTTFDYVYHIMGLTYVSDVKDYIHGLDYDLL